MRIGTPAGIAAIVWFVGIFVAAIPVAVVITALGLTIAESGPTRYVPVVACMIVAAIPAAIVYVVAARRA